MQLRLIVLLSILVLSCLVTVHARTTKSSNRDLDGIGSDLEDFIRHRDTSQNYQGFNRRQNGGDLNSVPSSGSRNKSTLDRITSFFKKVLAGN